VRKKRVIKESDLNPNFNETTDSAEIEKSRVLKDEKNGIYASGLRVVGI
jgi:hypothetical protein